MQAIFGLLIGIFLLRAFVDTPGLSLVFLAVFPIVMAAFVLGRTAAIVAAAIATVLSVVVPIINPATHVSTAAQIVGAVGRAAVYVGLALLVSSLLERETKLRFSLAESERERAELESLRAALTAPDLPAVDGIQIATSYTPADGPGGGRLLPRHPRRRRTAPSWWSATSSATAWSPRAAPRTCAPPSRSSPSTPTTR